MPKFLKILLIVLLVLVILVFAVAFPIISVTVYNSIFNVRIETDPEDYFSADDYEGLTVENVTFATKQGHNLAGYKYRMEDTETPKGVVLFVHGFGGGGHCGYMPGIAYLVENGYAVFSYDATGNDASEGKYIGGFPQGIIDLDYAIRYVKSDAEYSGLPIFLVGHSWGAYSVGNVLNFHTDISGAAIFAGFNESKLLIRQTGLEYVGKVAELMVPYVQAYEWIKYGEYALTSVNEGIAAAENTAVMVIHSKDDGVVLPENGYDLFIAEHGDNERVQFALYDDRGHDYLFYSSDTMAERLVIDADYDFYLIENGLEDTDENYAAFRKESIDYSVYYKMDDEIMGQVLAMFDSKIGG